MRTKIFSMLLALMLCVGAFALPMTAYAAPATESTEASESTAATEPTETTEPTKQPETSEPAEDDTSEETEGDSSSALMDEIIAAMLAGAFTPDGTGSILDYDINYDEDKQFYTITTEAGNIFYLIIDGKREDNNVYFLNAVTEQDLMALAEKSDNGTTVSGISTSATCSCENKCETGAVNTECAVCKNDLSGCTAETAQTGSAEPAAESNAGTIGLIIFIAVGMLAVIGVGYYVKVIRPKKDADDEDEFETEDYGEGFDPDAEYGQPEYLEDNGEDAEIPDDDEE